MEDYDDILDDLAYFDGVDADDGWDVDWDLNQMMRVRILPDSILLHEWG